MNADCKSHLANSLRSHRPGERIGLIKLRSNDEVDGLGKLTNPHRPSDPIAFLGRWRQQVLSSEIEKLEAKVEKIGKKLNSQSLGG